MSQEDETVTSKLGCRRFGQHTVLRALNICRSYCIEAIHLYASCRISSIWVMLFEHSFVVMKEFSSGVGVHFYFLRYLPMFTPRHASASRLLPHNTALLVSNFIYPEYHCSLSNLTSSSSTRLANLCSDILQCLTSILLQSQDA